MKTSLLASQRSSTARVLSRCRVGAVPAPTGHSLPSARMSQGRAKTLSQGCGKVSIYIRRLCFTGSYQCDPAHTPPRRQHVTIFTADKTEQPLQRHHPKKPYLAMTFAQLREPYSLPSDSNDREVTDVEQCSN
jgi:hypothetical protein